MDEVRRVKDHHAESAIRKRQRAEIQKSVRLYGDDAPTMYIAVRTISDTQSFGAAVSKDSAWIVSVMGQQER